MVLLLEDRVDKVYNIVKKLIPCNFGPNYESDSSEVEDTIWEITRTTREKGLPVYCSYGASKFCINPANAAYVLKVPFNGYWDWSYNDDEEGYEFYEFENCNSNYCEEEANLYDMAVEDGLEIFFAETKLYGFDTYGGKIYLQEKVDTVSDGLSTPSASRESQKKAEELSYDAYGLGLSTFFLAELIEWYGEEKTHAFLDWCMDMGINDLTDSNVGFRLNGQPCVCDFSGFWD